MELDVKVRSAAFDWLSKQVQICGDIVLPRTVLQKGFEISGHRVPLMSPQGIFTPKVMDYPISITTVLGSRYDDVITKTDFILYKYRGNDPQHRDNVGLRKAMELRLPLVYFHGVVPGKYVATWPVYIVGDNPHALEFRVATGESGNEAEKNVPERMALQPEEKEYVTREVLYRVHQKAFRERVLMAYREQCALCKLRHKQLLDAAHIIPDSKEHSRVTVDNGISLCKLHHAAFDQFFIGITPDFKVEVKQEILEEEDGPMLQHGLKELHETKIILPNEKANWPDRDSLSERYSQFTEASL